MTAYDRFRRLVEARGEVKGKDDRTAEHRTRCPAHDDHTPSLDFREKGGTLVLACRSAGCAPDAILAALGTSWRELRADDAGPSNGHRPRATEPRTLYTWHRLDGGTATHVRIGDGPGKSMPWDPRGTQTADLRVYGAELLAGWDPAEPVWWAEGEKAADALRAAGLQAVSWTGKDTAPSPAALAELAGHRVIVWPDNDADGIAQGHRIAAALDGIAADVRWLDPSGWAPKADAADILAPGATGHELRAGQGADPGAVAGILERIGPVPPAPEVPAPEARARSGPTAHLSRQSLAALHFVEAAGHRVRFDHGRRAWLIWRGHRWELDRTAEIRRLWLDVLADRYREALTIEDGDRRARTLEAIQTAGATDAAIESGIRIAASSEPVAMAGDEWDADPWLLGCENGVVNLRDGTLRPGRPDDLITRSTGLAYDPDATCPRWDRFLVEVFAGDRDLVRWFALLIGASFVGTSKEVLALHHGGGNNGKSVCFRTLCRHVAGDYGVEIGIETLTNAKRDAGASSSDLMRLRGARLAFTSEPDQGARLKGGTLKRLATIDQMSARELYGRQQEWDPTHTIHLASNHLPEADDASDGFWRRIALVPWEVRFGKAGEPGPPEDPNLSVVLAREAPGILAWAVRGAVAFASSGTVYPFPTAVARGTAAYRAEEDPIGDFLAGWVHAIDDDAIVSSGALFAAYTAWADAVGVPKAERLNSRSFGRMFAERHKTLPWPIKRVVSAGRTGYRGIRIGVPGSESGPEAPQERPANPPAERENGPISGVGGFSDHSPETLSRVGNRKVPGITLEKPPTHQGPVGSGAAHVDCRDARAHYASIHRASSGSGFVCDICEADDDPPWPDAAPADAEPVEVTV